MLRKDCRILDKTPLSIVLDLLIRSKGTFISNLLVYPALMGKYRVYTVMTLLIGAFFLLGFAISQPNLNLCLWFDTWIILSEK